MRSKCPSCGHPLTVPSLEGLPTKPKPAPDAKVAKPAAKPEAKPATQNEVNVAKKENVAPAVAIESPVVNEPQRPAPTTEAASFAPHESAVEAEDGPASDFSFPDFGNLEPERSHDEHDQYVYIDDDAETELKIDRERVSVARWVIYAQGILLGVVALGSFSLGFLSRGGGDGGPSRPEQRMPHPVTVSGRVTYAVSSGEKFPDDGAVVIVVPQGERPGVDEKVRFEGLRPKDSLPDETHEGLSVIRLLGGGYARTDIKGEFRMRLPDGGKFYVLVISRHGERKAATDFVKSDLAQMGHYFLSATDLIGDRRYRWRAEEIYRDRRLTLE